jgi:small subunit ribosomal protein S6
MPLYEHVFLARQDVSNAQVEALTKEYAGIIEEGGGKVTKAEYWGLKALAYKIKKSRKAHFSLLNIDAPHDAIAEMERRMGLSTEVIRFLTLKVGGRGGFRGGGGRGGFRGDRDGPGGRSRPPPRGDREGGDRTSTPARENADAPSAEAKPSAASSKNSEA